MIKDLFHLLVVDDDDRIRDLVKQYLEENNFLVTTATDAFDAQKKIDVIISVCPKDLISPLNLLYSAFSVKILFFLLSDI